MTPSSVTSASSAASGCRTKCTAHPLLRRSVTGRRNLASSLPFDSPRRFRGNVVHHAVYRRDFVDDAVGDSREEVVRETGPVGGHGVFGGDGADGDDVAVGAVVA